MKIAIRVVVIAACVILIWLFVRDIDWSALGETLRTAKLWPLIPAVLIAFGMLWCHSVGLRAILGPRYPIATTKLFRYTVLAYAASILAPLRAGELVRLWLLERDHGVPLTEAAGAVIAQKIIDGLVMIVLFAPIPLVVDAPPWIGRAIAIGAAAGVAVVVALAVALPRLQTRARRSWWVRFLSSMHVLRAPRRLTVAIGAHLLAWLIDVAMVVLVLHAVGLEVPLAAAMVILFALNVAIIAPTPGHAGSLEVGVLAATYWLGIADERALAFALLYHACLVVPILIAGLILELPLRGLGPRSLSRTRRSCSRTAPAGRPPGTDSTP